MNLYGFVVDDPIESDRPIRARSVRVAELSLYPFRLQLSPSRPSREVSGVSWVSTVPHAATRCDS